jgi:hypothetical protein
MDHEASVEGRLMSGRGDLPTTGEGEPLDPLADWVDPLAEGGHPLAEGGSPPDEGPSAPVEDTATPDGRDGGQGPTQAARLLAVAALAVLVVLSGTLLTRAGSSPPRAAPAGSRVASGAWFCPHGGGQGFTGWISIANPGSASVRVRTTTFGANGPILVRNFMLAPSHESYRQIPVADPGASTEVEYFGGWVAAGSVIRSSGPDADVAASRCVGGRNRGWFLPDETTAADEKASIVVMNPYGAPAEFNVVIRTNLPRTVRPGPLSPVVLEPYRATAIPVNPWALEGANEDTVTVQIVPEVGGVIAGSLVSSPRGLRSEAGLADGASRWALPAVDYGAPVRIVVQNAGRDTATLSVEASGSGGPRVVPDASGSTLEPGAVRTFGVGEVADAGILLDAGRSDVLAAMRMTGPGGGEATIVGWPAPERRWAVPPTLPVTGGTAQLALQNPTAYGASVRIEWIGPDGPVRSGPSAVQVPAGRTIAVASPNADVPLFALVTTVRGSIVAGGTSRSIGSSAFAASVGVPLG